MWKIKEMIILGGINAENLHLFLTGHCTESLSLMYDIIYATIVEAINFIASTLNLDYQRLLPAD